MMWNNRLNDIDITRYQLLESCLIFHLAKIGMFHHCFCIVTVAQEGTNAPKKSRGARTDFIRFPHDSYRKSSRETVLQGIVTFHTKQDSVRRMCKRCNDECKRIKEFANCLPRQVSFFVLDALCLKAI